MKRTSQTYFHRSGRYWGEIRDLTTMVVLLLLTSACGAIQPMPTAFPAEITATRVVEATASPTSLATPTPFLTVFAPTPAPPTPDATSTATIQPNPLEFIYPTQGSLPVAGWRPPLYPTPWAPTLFDHFFFASPIAANETNEPVFDYRYGGVFFEDVVHTGIDIPAPKGTPILAAGPGTVIWAGYGVYKGGYDPTDPYGMAVTIQHDFGYQNQALYTIYGHMSEIDVVEGQHVDTGDRLGLVGETGVVTGPHLHFELRIGKNDFFTTRNPELWLVPAIGYGILAGRLTDSIGQNLYDQQLIITGPQNDQNWFAWSYGKTTVNSDSYYQENLVIGNLPAGVYLLRTDFGGVGFKMPIEVHAGVVNYFTFRGYWGFTVGSPPAPGADFTPEPFETSIP
jgi:murein DD-endopeptidase MepM/ murein hydrolase activator NlpD